MRFWYQHHNVNAKSNFQKEDQNAAKENRKCWTWVRILSFIYTWQGTEATARNIIINDTPAQVFSNEFCEILKNILFIEHPRATAFKEM